eukprot:TRINITY_DN1922_c0_g1_i2.p1 TRINITY_DN1922_c0_g1~~TRINITY_DN1922_c0_g1_i2.p1  ORF type:complete len:313 (-),score=81.63 TRINITY_DN1922_c0_g1_i2:52-990(-)
MSTSEDNLIIPPPNIAAAVIVPPTIVIVPVVVLALLAFNGKHPYPFNRLLHSFDSVFESKYKGDTGRVASKLQKWTVISLMIYPLSIIWSFLYQILLHNSAEGGLACASSIFGFIVNLVILYGAKKCYVRLTFSLFIANVIQVVLAAASVIYLILFLLGLYEIGPVHMSKFTVNVSPFAAVLIADIVVKLMLLALNIYTVVQTKRLHKVITVGVPPQGRSSVIDYYEYNDEERLLGNTDDRSSDSDSSSSSPPPPRPPLTRGSSNRFSSATTYSFDGSRPTTEAKFSAKAPGDDGELFGTTVSSDAHDDLHN